jgi:phosphoglycolate phosphatase
LKTEENHKTNPDALLFDMDGTLWDAVNTYTLAWNKYFENHGLGKRLTKNDLDTLMGLEEGAFLDIVLPEFSKNERAQRYKEVVQLQYDLIDDIGGEIYPGVAHFLPLLHKKYKLFIVSNCPEFTIKHFMKFARIDALITDSFSHGQNYKAKHENISSLISTYQLKRPLYIGDTNSDMIQSKKAGIPFVFMNYGFGQCTSFDQSFDSFEDFAKYYLNAYI